MNRNPSLALACLVTACFVGCGGGGSSGSTVTTTPSPPAAAAPTITTQPASASVTVGQTATFTVVATGTSPLTYQWQQNGAAISGATSASYTTPATVSSDNGEKFTVVVTNSAGNVTSAAASLSVTTPSPPAAAGTDVTTFKNDTSRTGQNLTETTLTPANVTSATFGLLQQLMVDGKVDAQPLYLSQLTIGAASHNVVFVATENDSVYAFDADTYAKLWMVSLLQPGETTSDTHSCGQVVPQIGITATPVIDRTAGPHGVVYVVAAGM